MTELEQIQQSVSALSDEEIWQFENWFAELRNDRWDKQIEADSKAGRLDKLAARALAELRAGKIRAL